jgi:hypothetical protein
MLLVCMQKPLFINDNTTDWLCLNLGVDVVPVSYREKIRVGGSEIIFFFEYFFHGFFNN